MLLDNGGAGHATFATAELPALRDVFTAAAGPSTVVSPATRDDLFLPLVRVVMDAAPLSAHDAASIVVPVLDALCVPNTVRAVPEHISDDGLTALCGASLVIPPEERLADVPLCRSCTERTEQQGRRPRVPRLLRHVFARGREDGWPRGRTARQARRVYFAGDQRMGRAWEQLASQTDPERRAGILADLALDAQLGGELYLAAFGPDPIPGEGGRDMAQAAASEALLLTWLSITEIASHRDQDGLDERIAANNHPPPWPATRPHLDRLCQTTDPAARARLVDDLYAAVVDHIGGQAAETLTAVARAYRDLAARAPVHLPPVGSSSST
jgi:hypothetical protein